MLLGDFDVVGIAIIPILALLRPLPCGPYQEPASREAEECHVSRGEEHPFAAAERDDGDVAEPRADDQQHPRTDQREHAQHVGGIQDGGMTSITSSPAETVISSEIGWRLAPIGSA